MKKNGQFTLQGTIIDCLFSKNITLLTTVKLVPNTHTMRRSTISFET
jgi:hypothetical protein